MLSQTSIPEVKENEIGYALQQRRLKLSQFHDLGPPDLVTLVKSLPSSKSSTSSIRHPTSHHSSSIRDDESNNTTSTNNSNNTNTGSKVNSNKSNGIVSFEDQSSILANLHTNDKLKGEIGTYFYILGVDTSDPTAISIFGKNLADTIAESPQLWFGKKKNFHVAKLSYSSWNAFRKCDVNIVINIPGNVRCYILDSNGEQLQLPLNYQAPSSHQQSSPNTNDNNSTINSNDNDDDATTDNIPNGSTNDQETNGTTKSNKKDDETDTNKSENFNVNKEMDLIWAETFVSGVIRSIMVMKDNRDEGEIHTLVETLVLNPFTSGELGNVADNFIKAFPMVYESGVLLDAPSHVLNPSPTNNYLTETLLEVVKSTHNIKLCEGMLKDLIQIHPEAVAILIRVYFICDLEIDAINLLNIELSKSNLDFTIKSPTPEELIFKSELLVSQAEFLIDVKKDYSMARDICNFAVNCTPNEFKPWYVLAKAYIKLNDIENALLSLNACPMTQLKEKYVLRRIVPIPSDSNLHLPLPLDAVLDDIISLDLQDIQREQLKADSNLINLPALKLKSTFQMVYKLLSEIVKSTGWEKLLKYRSKIFVMEEEYQDSSSSSLQLELPEPNRIRSKRLCERWLDNLLMLLYEDLKTFAIWQTDVLQPNTEENSTNNGSGIISVKKEKLTVEWELFGSCASRLGHPQDAITAFKKGLSQRFDADCAKKLLNLYIDEHKRLRNDVFSTIRELQLTSSQILQRINDLDIAIIDLCVRITCWNHRWYVEFSPLLLDALSIAVEDMDLTKVANEIVSRYPSTVARLVDENALSFLRDYTNDAFDS